MVFKKFSLQGFAVQLILFLYNHVSPRISSSASRVGCMPTSALIHGTPALKVGVGISTVYASAPRLPVKAKIQE
ncbi:hypothetical protein ANAPRD1_01315 [Anaplasma phagocytophilum]|nr:hypothetical protein ANAPC5_01334 [Anaplasma phagocytophilum]SCV66798.1 hypothetical protein ANAPRD1_01315 [Anaplasma phagocytophilum]